MSSERPPAHPVEGHHDPLADDQDLLTLNEALIRIQDEVDELRREVLRLEQQGRSVALDGTRRRLAIVEDAAERYRRLNDKAR